MTLTRRGVISAGIGAFAALPAVAGLQNAGRRAGHVVLLGDSIFDNKKYVGGKPAVIEQLQKRLPEGWKATKLAEDRAVAADIPGQVGRLPDDATHLVLSVGGNDALKASWVLEMPANNGAQVFLALAKVRGKFATDYSAAVQAALKPGKPLVVCTVYDPNYSVGDRQSMAVAGLAVFNDVISREAVKRRVPVLDLRVLFTAKGDYANAIEPSVAGGQKIVDQVWAIATGHDFSVRQSTWYPKP